MVDAFIDMLEAHAEDALSRGETNQPYANQVRGRAVMVRDLLEGGAPGEVRGVVSTWTNDMRPIAELLFGVGLEERRIGDHVDYSPTVFDGVKARVRMLSSDEMLGPTLSLDMISDADQVNPAGQTD